MSSADPNKSGLYIKFFEDKSGNLAVFQKPNLPIMVWFATFVLGIMADGNLLKIIDVVGFGALFTWVWLELFQGVSYFRRSLGFLVLFITIINRIN